MAQEAADRALVLEIQRMSTEDGPGIRTTVFLKGCTLACDWCHNPESISPARQIIWHDQRCIGCRLCLSACPNDARRLNEAGVEVDTRRCLVCGRCVSECPTTAADRIGTFWDVEELVVEIAKDRTFFTSSGGGITLSGGEPAMQARPLARLLDLCREEGIHTAVDTCGMCSADRLLSLTGRADLVLYDLKLVDAVRHRELTGQPNGQILENLVRVGEQKRETGRPAQLWIRTPLIPGATATGENIRGIGALLASGLGDLLDRWELCAFNNLCGHKYRRLGLPWPYEGEELLSAEERARLENVAKTSGVDPVRIRATGATRVPQGRLK